MRIFPLFFLFSISTCLSGNIRSYTDDNGIRVFTNVGVRRTNTVTVIDEVQNGSNYYGIIQDTASRYGINKDLVEAIIRVESNFDASAVSEKDCKGLMQLHPDTAKRFGVDDIFDPSQNIEGGVKYISYLMDFFDQKLDYVLAAYNAGENAVLRHDGIPPYRETKKYVSKVKSLFSGSISASQATSSRRRTVRVVRLQDASGNILFTNTPAD